MIKKRVGVIGATGSIGGQAVEILSNNKDKFETVFLTAHNNVDLLNKYGKSTSAEHLFLSTDKDYLDKILDLPPMDIVLISSVGAVAIKPAFEFAKRGINLALANKECIVASGKILIETAKKSGAKIYPVDSEHSAIYQCLMGQDNTVVDKIILTASGGTFRDRNLAELKNVTISETLKHPNWSMGAKITVDSATMMNKGLELIEASYLFNMPPEKLSVVIHPQSIVHSMVSFKDGSVIAQLGMPDMRIPIAFALNYGGRMEFLSEKLDFTKNINLNFYPPDYNKYKALKIALDVLKSGDSAKMIIMNAANEVAVDAFLKERIGFLDITDFIEKVLDTLDENEPNSIEDVLNLDKYTREFTEKLLCRF